MNECGTEPECGCLLRFACEMPEYRELHQSSLLETSEFARAVAAEKIKKLTNLTNVSDVKMTRFGYRVD